MENFTNAEKCHNLYTLQYDASYLALLVLDCDRFQVTISKTVNLLLKSPLSHDLLASLCLISAEKKLQFDYRTDPAFLECQLIIIFTIII